MILCDMWTIPTISYTAFLPFQATIKTAIPTEEYCPNNAYVLLSRPLCATMIIVSYMLLFFSTYSMDQLTNMWFPSNILPARTSTSYN